MAEYHYLTPSVFDEYLAKFGPEADFDRGLFSEMATQSLMAEAVRRGSPVTQEDLEAMHQTLYRQPMPGHGARPASPPGMARWRRCLRWCCRRRGQPCRRRGRPPPKPNRQRRRLSRPRPKRRRRPPRRNHRPASAPMACGGGRSMRPTHPRTPHPPTASAVTNAC